MWNRSKDKDARDVEGSDPRTTAEVDEHRDGDYDRNDDGNDRNRDADGYDRDTPAERAAAGERLRREEFGGMNLGAGFFGWLVATGMAILLSGIVGAVAAGVGNANDVTQSELERKSGTIGVTAAIVLLVILLISYYAGGYVAGRMSRFDGFRQGFGVWLIGLVVVIIAAGVGAIFGSQYNVLDRVNLPDVPIPTNDLSLGGAITIAAVVVGTLLAAMVGGKAGMHYHNKVDRVV